MRPEHGHHHPPTAATRPRAELLFYVPGRDPVRIRDCSLQADAIVVSGAAGPRSVCGLRRSGWDGIALFDRAAYVANPGKVDPPEWFDQQEEAGADRLLTPGRFVGAARKHEPFDVQVEPEVALAQRNHATCVLCIDYRWLTKSDELVEMRTFLEGLDVAVALVLADRGDPISHPGAVDGLTMLTRRIPGLSILRCDHGAIGALPSMQPTGRWDFRPRIATLCLRRRRHQPSPTIRQLASSSATLWIGSRLQRSAAGQRRRCRRRVAAAVVKDAESYRFLDPRYAGEADLHNRLVLRDLALEILQIPEDTHCERQAFSKLCRKAIENYGSMGTRLTEIKPKPQLEQWAQYA